MRNYRSSGSRHSAVTGKLIQQNGRLKEFTFPVRVSDLLRQNPDCFICSSDDMEFDEIVVEIGGDEVLQPGEIYFELPLRWRNHQLQPADLAALAVKASVALTTYSTTDSNEYIVGCCCCVSRKVEPVMLVFSEKERFVAAAGGSGDRKGSKFVAKLSAIEE